MVFRRLFRPSKILTGKPKGSGFNDPRSKGLPFLSMASNPNNYSQKNIRRLIVGAFVITLGATLVANRKNEKKGLVYSPTRIVSRMTGNVARREMPKWFRKPFLGFYSWFYGVIHEELDRPLEDFNTIEEFFTRSLKEGSRKLDNRYDGETGSLVSPCDGKVLNLGELDGTEMLLVKGKRLSVAELLTGNRNVYNDPKRYVNLLLQKNTAEKPSKLGYAILYLAPGDYHRFHSPTDWLIRMRRHLPGGLLPVSKPIIKYVKENVYGSNERVALLGSWNHGFFSYVAVGATNVGTVQLHCDLGFKMNSNQFIAGPFERAFFPLTEEEAKVNINVENDYFKQDKEGVHVSAFNEIGFFRLGSTIVLVFEYPEDQHVKWFKSAGDTVRLGEMIFQVEKDADKKPKIKAADASGGKK